MEAKHNERKIVMMFEESYIFNQRKKKRGDIGNTFFICIFRHDFLKNTQILIILFC